MCTPDRGCREGFLCATCSVNTQHRDETRCQLTLCRTSRLTTFTWKVVHVQRGLGDWQVVQVQQELG